MLEWTSITSAVPAIRLPLFEEKPRGNMARDRRLTAIAADPLFPTL